MSDLKKGALYLTTKVTSVSAPERKTKGEVKNYVLDTNILLQNPQSLFGFAEEAIRLMK